MPYPSFLLVAVLLRPSMVLRDRLNADMYCTMYSVVYTSMGCGYHKVLVLNKITFKTMEISKGSSGGSPPCYKCCSLLGGGFSLAHTHVLFAMILNFKGYVHKTLTTSSRQLASMYKYIAYLDWTYLTLSSNVSDATSNELF